MLFDRVRAQVPLLILIALAGCSQGDSQTRFRVSGAITYDGQPVEFGEVLFTPDGAKGNSGAQGIATISKGRYDTSGSRAPGVAGGPMIVRVTASKDAQGTLLSEQEFELDLPKSDTTHDIKLEKSAKPAVAAPAI
jgi:hypothetical protein